MTQAPDHIRIVFCGTGWLPMVDAIRQRLPSHATIRTRDPQRPLIPQLQDVHVILPSNCRIDADAIDAPEQLLLIQQPAVGCEVVDLEAARARGVPVCNAPAANSEATAQTAILLMLALARKLPLAAQAFKQARVGEPLGIELTEKSLGIVGFGRIGKRVAHAAEALGMRIVSTCSSSSPDDFKALLEQSDFISINCPLTKATHELFSHKAFACVKPGAYLINVARAAIIHREALDAALDSGRLAGVGLDVHWQEPWDPKDPLYARPNVVALPHVGGASEEAFARIAEIVVGNIGRVARGEPLEHRIA